MSKQYKSALIYCRVSSQRQVKEGNGLGSQEKRCRNHAVANSYKVEKVFEEEGVSGSLFDRPAMKKMIDYIDAHPDRNYVVIFDDLKRFARDYDVHRKLKMELVVARSVKLECLNFDFKNTAESEFIEGVLALHAELERKQNRRQVIQKMKARLERGYWCFYYPLGLKTVKDPQHGKILVSDEPYATILKEAIEGYENNLLNSQQEVRDFIKQRYVDNRIDKPISIHSVQDILKNPLYAGLIEYKPWDVPLGNGAHKGFISPETFHNVQDKLSGRSKPKFNKSFSEDFPLRRFVTCSYCGSKLRGSWNKGRTKRYPNYWCQDATKQCPYRYKVTKADEMHTGFESLLNTVEIDTGMKDLSKAILLDLWDSLVESEQNNKSHISDRLSELDKQVASLTARITKTEKETLILNYETELDKLLVEKESLASVDTKPKYTKEKFGTCLSRVYKTLEDPLLLWNSEYLDDKRTVLYMFFENGLSYDYETGFGTANFSDGINLLRKPEQADFRDVEMRELWWNQVVEWVMGWENIQSGQIRSIQMLSIFDK